MHREYQKWFSPALGREMELLSFGHAGTPVLVFPTSMGRFYEYEDRGMVAAVAERIDAGKLRLMCVDSVDAESWYNKGIHPRDRVRRHRQYERYILDEALPLLLHWSGASRVALTGCSFGGYHCVNFALRNPDLFHASISMGGAFDIHQFLNGWFEEDAYFQCPPDYLSNMTDEWYLSSYRNGLRLVLATGEHDICLAENVRLSNILGSKAIPHYLDIWGNGTGHDWPWWRDMARKFL